MPTLATKPDWMNNIPRDLTKLTKEQREEWAQWEYESYTLAQLRQRQTIIESQIKRAYKLKLTDSLNSLYIREYILERAVSLYTGKQCDCLPECPMYCDGRCGCCICKNAAADDESENYN